MPRVSNMTVISAYAEKVKFINSTARRKLVTGNRFSYIGFLYGREILAVRCCFLSLFAYFGDFSLRMRSFNYISSFLLLV